jgi:tetratricopeptide (TPR) repeat protein
MIVSAAFGLNRQKKYDQSIAEMRKALQMDPAVARTHAQLGMTLLAAGQHDEAINELETAVRLAQKNRRFQGDLGLAYGLTGRTADARKVLEALERRAQQEYVSPVAIAMVHAGLRENDQALHWLERAYEQRDFDLLFTQRSLAFEPLRNEPRFRELMRRIGLPEA